MAKADLIAEAEELGLELTGEETVAELETLLADNRPEADEEEDGGEEAAEDENVDEGDDVDEDEDSEPETKVDASPDVPTGPGIHVFTARGAYIRTYSSKVHGSKYKELAKMFVTKNEAKGFVTKGK